MLFKKILRLSRRIFFEDFEVLLPQCDKVQKAARSRTIMKGIRDDSGWNDLAFCTRIKAGSIAELLASCPLYQEMWRAHIGAKDWAVSAAGREA